MEMKRAAYDPYRSWYPFYGWGGLLYTIRRIRYPNLPHFFIDDEHVLCFLSREVCNKVLCFVVDIVAVN
jgi:hypothetical protein